ncbi:ATP-dependent DNA helicase, RecQ-like [Clostridium sp. DSM 8431]|uniref:DNA helicase RecQ n=1 Tax=Clostridium sp. DSM 8431 TaxID=1761781 RepID=UPI0008F2DD37|nr:DNA helicase RecQ [Clostridium sp. DSM 8431]SFU68359.1 ATP-dependent DNA helicase, RecQ-like [Clostridium sp. DSM 8431]
MNKAVDILNKYYGYKEFRKGQKDIIDTITGNRDVLAIMPTGGGKSICYQIPALIMEGITIVISPLISLMKDQVDSLRDIGVKAAYINSTLDNMEFQEVLYNLKNNNIKIIYIAPERLDSLEFLNIISELNISQVAVDEAHCVSTWGHDFRVSYRKINGFIKRLSSNPVVTAFTATASKEVQKDIVKLLNLNNPKVFISGFDRENLSINIIKDGRKDLFLKEYVSKNSKVSGIIYCATRKEVDSIYSYLCDNNYKAGKYHAGLRDDERKEFQEKFINDDVDIMVATNAFGMGIDKSNIRYIIHYNMPQNIEGYYQEIGRAGRDGEKSECYLLFTPGDVHLQKYLIDTGIRSEDRRVIAYKKLQDMVSLVYSTGCYRRYILEYFGEERKENCNNCSNCLSESEEIDRTVDAQKVLSCIGRMKRPFGITMVVDVLRGSKNKKILSLGFHELSTYGLMKEYKKEDLVTFINRLVSHRIIDLVEGTYPVLRLNAISLKVLRGEEKVVFKESVKIKEIESEDNGLFNILKELRHFIASEEKVPPYVIFSDRSLREMSKSYPITKEEFLSISGVGEIKYDKYGETFIDRIKDYKIKNNIKKEDIKDTSLPLDFLVTTDENLYEELRKLRAEFADKENKSPYYIISQDTLKEISGRYPCNLEQLKDIGGMGPKKIEMYGKEIIELVNSYVENNNIEVKWTKKGRLKLIIDGEDRKHNEIAIDMINEGYDIKNISDNMEISVSTILGYVTDYIKENKKIEFTLNLEKYFNENEEEDILKVCNKIGIENISMIKKNLNSAINYEAIRAVILKHFYNIA